MTADLRREEIARIAAVLVPLGGFAGHKAADVWREGSAYEVAEALYDAGLRSQDTATARIAELEGALRAVLDAGDAFDMADSSYALGLANGSIVAATKLARAVLSGETRTDGETDRE